jgi:hypothetical protein
MERKRIEANTLFGMDFNISSVDNARLLKHFQMDW